MKKMIVMMIVLMMSCIAVGQTISNPLPAKADTSKKKCTAITAKGVACTRNVGKSGILCWQHENVKANTPARIYYRGSNGGVYYINSKGNKVYTKTK